MFEWALARQLIDPKDNMVMSLKSVKGLRQGKTGARESDPVNPVPDEHVDAILQFLSPQVRGMVELQEITGMRLTEVCIMRSCDIDTRCTTWRYRPQTHKTKHRGHDRVIDLGRHAREIVAAFLKPDVRAYVFSPSEATIARRALRHAARKTPESCGNVAGDNVVAKPKIAPGERYNAHSYRPRGHPGVRSSRSLGQGRMVIGNDERVIDRWHPHQLRHSAATRWRSEFGPDIALTLLGDRTTRMIDVYAEKDRATASRVMEKIG